MIDVELHRYKGEAEKWTCAHTDNKNQDASISGNKIIQSIMKLYVETILGMNMCYTRHIIPKIKMRSFDASITYQILHILLKLYSKYIHYIYIVQLYGRKVENHSPSEFIVKHYPLYMPNVNKK